MQEQEQEQGQQEQEIETEQANEKEVDGAGVLRDHRPVADQWDERKQQAD